MLLKLVLIVISEIRLPENGSPLTSNEYSTRGRFSLVQLLPIGSNWTRLYRPLVEYSFEVRGEPFSGKRISLITINTSFKSMAETEARQFVVGAKVTVYFNPSDPRQCVLDRRGPKDDSGALIVMALAGAAFLAGLLAVSGALKLG